MNKNKLKAIFGILIPLSMPSFAENNVKIANQIEVFGLYNADLTEHYQTEASKNVPKQALWYFKNQVIATPKSAEHVTQISPKPAMQDLANLNTNTLPPLIWLGSHDVISNVTLLDDKMYRGNDQQSDFNHPYFIEEKIPTNISFWDNSTDTFFKNRAVRMRGEMTNRGFIARTVWPKDFKLNLAAPLRPIQWLDETFQSITQTQQNTQKPFASRLLWGKSDGLEGKAALGIMLNGAQGDDDEAHGGHFALATGRVGKDGDMSQWLVNNYYNLANNSEKGIIAGATPLDKYMADVNSGQSYYRPSSMLVVVFKTDAVPTQVQAATNRVMTHFYRNDFVYDHASANCTGLSIDTLRELGLKVPTRGVESHLKAIAAYFFVAAKERSLTKGRSVYDYLSTETTRLYPAVAFDTVSYYLLKLTLPHHKIKLTPYEQQIKQEIEAIYFVHIPQIPSSRAFGRAPVYGFDEYMSRVPADPKDWKTAPATPNPFPEELKDGLALKLEKPSLVPLPVAIVFTLLIFGLLVLFRKIWHLKTVNYFK